MTSSHSNIKTKLLSAFPFEVIDKGSKTFKFIVINYFTNLFSPFKVHNIIKKISEYIEKFVLPSWRIKASIQIYVPPSQRILKEDMIFEYNTWVNTIEQPGTYIPIYLIDEFSNTTIPNNYATAVHGCVSGSIVSGINPSNFIDGRTYKLIGPVPFGTPFIVVPAGSIATNNGINAQIIKNRILNEGPIDYYQCLSLILCREIIAILINPSGVSYIASGDPLGLGESEKIHAREIFYIKEAVVPFSQGNDNCYIYDSYVMSNFAYPAYFFPYNTSKIYDFLGKCSAPLTPYKGIQFVIYQEKSNGIISDLQIGKYISLSHEPNNIIFKSYGSIYDYVDWNSTEWLSSYETFKIKNNNYKHCVTTKLLIKEPLIEEPLNTKFEQYNNILKKKLKIRNNNFCDTTKLINKEPLNIEFELYNDVFKKILKTGNNNCCSKNKPQLLPFQYISNNGWLTTRFAIINYIPNKLDPSIINNIIPVMEKYMNEQFLPYWNITAKIIGNYTIYSDKDLPIFDGTFIPFFYLKIDQFDTNKYGYGPLAGGAWNLCNVPNIIAGPIITEFLQQTNTFSVPKIPLGNPYMLCSETNFLGEVIITTNQQGIGPFRGVPTASSMFISIDFPLTKKAGVARDDITACTPLIQGSLSDKIGINIRNGKCDSLLYPSNLANAGAIAFITVYSEETMFSATGSPIWGCTIGLDGQKLIDAIENNPDLLLTITPISTRLTYNTFSKITTHELQELVVNPTYANYYLTGNPQSDDAILFSHYETCDPIEAHSVIASLCDNSDSYSMSPFVIPSYFHTYMRNNNYDNVGIISNSLNPASRQQIIFQQKGLPLQVSNVQYEYPQSILTNVLNIFDRNSFYPPLNPPTPDILISDTPLKNIYYNIRYRNNPFTINL